MYSKKLIKKTQQKVKVNFGEIYFLTAPSEKCIITKHGFLSFAKFFSRQTCDLQYNHGHINMSLIVITF